MGVCWLLDSRARESAEALWTIGQIAPLLDAPWRMADESAAPRDREAAVFVGAPERAPAHAAAVVPFGDWPRWDPATLGVATFDRTPLPCPGGSCPPPAPREMPAIWLRALFFLLSREEELADVRRDRWECYSGFYSRLHELKLLDRALVNAHAARLRERLDAWCRANGRTLERVARWPGGAPFAATLSHDVDDVSLRSLAQAWRLLAQARSPGSYAFRGGLAAVARALRRGGAPDPYESFERWIAEESGRGFRSTFYFCPPAPARRHEYDALYTLEDTIAFEGRRVTIAALMRELHARGFEVALHGSYLSHVSAEQLASQKRQIESGLGAPVAGIRQHYLRFDRARTWDAQEQAGFTCDATLGYNETPGFRAGIAAPFHPWSAKRRGAHAILELPLTCMDGALFRSLRLDPEQASAAVLDHLAEAESAGGLASLLWHPNAAAEDLFPGWWRCYLVALAQLAARGAWVAPAREVERWWRERSQRLVGD
jgi:hypothetical protein